MRDIDDSRGQAASATANLVPGVISACYLAAVLVAGWLVFGRFRPAALPVVDGMVDPWWAGWILLATAGGWWLRRGLQRMASAPPALLQAPRLPEALAPRIGPEMSGSPAWQQFGLDMLDARAFDPYSAERAPTCDLDRDACIARLHELRGAWTRAHAEREGRTARLLWLDLVLVLLDRGVVRALHDGQLPDMAALRTERLLLGADGGPAVLSEVPALLARRVELALERLPPAQRDAGDAHWQLLQSLQPLLEQERQLERRSQLVLALAWNADVDLDQVEVGYALADEYRLHVHEWLQRAASVIVPGRGRLDGWLLAGCDLSAGDVDDAIGHVEALRPLHAAIATLLQDTVAALVELAHAGEQRVDAPSAPRELQTPGRVPQA